MLQMLEQDMVRSPVAKNHLDRDIAADIFVSSSPILSKFSRHANLPRKQTMRRSGDLPNSKGHFLRLNNSS